MRSAHYIASISPHVLTCLYIRYLYIKDILAPPPSTASPGMTIAAGAQEISFPAQRLTHFTSSSGCHLMGESLASASRGLLPSPRHQELSEYTIFVLLLICRRPHNACFFNWSLAFQLLQRITLGSTAHPSSTSFAPR